MTQLYQIETQLINEKLRYVLRDKLRLHGGRRSPAGYTDPRLTSPAHQRQALNCFRHFRNGAGGFPHYARRRQKIKNNPLRPIIRGRREIKMKKENPVLAGGAWFLGNFGGITSFPSLRRAWRRLPSRPSLSPRSPSGYRWSARVPSPDVLPLGMAHDERMGFRKPWLPKLR